MGFPFKDATKVTMAFWLKANSLPSNSWVAPVCLSRGSGLWPRVDANGTIQFDLFTTVAGQGFFTYTPTPTLRFSTGVAAHWMAVFDGSGSGPGTLSVYRNGIPVLSASTGINGPNYFADRTILTLGNFGPHYGGFQDGDIELGDVAIWKGYAGTEQDAVDLTDQVKRPSDIATPQRVIYFTGDGGTAGNDVEPSDAGVANAGNDSTFASNEGFTYAFGITESYLRDSGQPYGSSVQGTLKYAAPLSYSPPVVATPYIPRSGEGLGFLFETVSGGKVHLPPSTTRHTLFGPGGAPTLTIHRSGGGTDTVTLDSDYAYFSNASSGDYDGQPGQGWVYFDLLGHGLAKIGPDDTAHVTAARHWVGFSEGYCAAIDADATRTSPLPPVPPGRKALRVGGNLQPPNAYQFPYFGNWAKRADDGRPKNSGGTNDYSIPRDPDNGQWIPGAGAPGGYFESVLLNPDGSFGMDGCATRGPIHDGSGNEQYPNAYYDNPAYGTEGFKLGNGHRAIPKRGKIHVAWDYYDGHDGDGEVVIRLAPYDNDFNQGVSGGSTSGPQVYSWTFNPTVHNGTGGLNYYRTYEYVGNDPINGLGDHGARLTPELNLRYTGYCTNIRVTIEADSDLPEAAWNVDKFNPPAFHPFLTGEMLKDVDTIRIMDWAGPVATGISGVDQFTPYGHYTWGYIFSNAVFDEGHPTEIAITSIVPYPEPEASALRKTYAGGAAGGGFPMKLVLASPHDLANGAVCQIDWGGCVTLTGVSDQDGVTYNARMDSTAWPRAARVVSGTELLIWAWFDQPGGGNPHGILSRTYTGPELGAAKVVVNRVRTLPLRAVGELATEAGVNVHYCLSYAIASDPIKAAAWADAVAPYFPIDRELYVESGNEPWNFYGPFSLSMGTAGDDLGLVGGQLPNFVQEYAHHVRISARAAKAIRQRWAAHGLDPAKVKCLINSGPGSMLSYAIPVIQEMNESGDPLLRVDEVACNTYWGNFGSEGEEGDDIAEFPGYAGLFIEQTLDIFELRVSRGNYPFVAARNQRAQLDEAGLEDVALTSYEGGSDRLTVGNQQVTSFDPKNEATQVACARLGRLQIGVFRNPRWAEIKQASLTRLQALGLKRQTQYTLGTPPTPGFYDGLGMLSRNFWTSYMSMERAGKGDGSDGLWDNRISDARPYGPFAEGDSVCVDAYAIKSWNAADSATNRPPTLILPAAVPAVTIGQPITFQATANDPDVGQALRFSLLPGAPDGTAIDPASGQFQWIPNQPGSWTITVRVTDDGSPPLSATGSVILRAVQKPKFVPRRRRSAK